MLAASFLTALGLCKRSLHTAAVRPRPPRVVSHPLRASPSELVSQGAQAGGQVDAAYLLLEDLGLLRATLLLRLLLGLQLELVRLAQLAFSLFWLWRFGFGGERTLSEISEAHLTSRGNTSRLGIAHQFCLLQFVSRARLASLASPGGFRCLNRRDVHRNIFDPT